MKHLNLDRYATITHAFAPGAKTDITETLWYSPKHNCFGVYTLYYWGSSSFETETKSGPVTGAPQMWGTKKDPWILVGRCE